MGDEIKKLNKLYERLEQEYQQAKARYNQINEEWGLLDHVMYPNGDGPKEFYRGWIDDIHVYGGEAAERARQSLHCIHYINILLEKELAKFTKEN